MNRVLLVLAVCCSSAFGQTLTRAPTFIKKVEPAGGVTAPGTVVMEVDVGPDGNVLGARVLSGLAPELDAAALPRAGEAASSTCRRR